MSNSANQEWPAFGAFLSLVLISELDFELARGDGRRFKCSGAVWTTRSYHVMDLNWTRSVEALDLHDNPALSSDSDVLP